VDGILVRQQNQVADQHLESILRISFGRNFGTKQNLSHIS
jgi:hypothetical protein